jgi:hypothetical protein
MPRHPIGDRAMTAAERMQRYRDRAKAKEKPKAELIKTGFWLNAEILAKLKSEAQRKDVTVSEEVNFRLKRSFTDDKLRHRANDRTHAVIRLLDAVTRATIGAQVIGDPPGPPADWLNDPAAFDQVVIGINATLNLIRPAGEIPAGGPRRGEFNALAILSELQKAPELLPANPSQHTIELTQIRAAIADVVDRAIIGGITADMARQSRRLFREFAVLRKKKWKLENPKQGKPATLSAKDRERMNWLAGEIEALLAVGGEAGKRLGNAAAPVAAGSN